jgi:hypothetical protein
MGLGALLRKALISPGETNRFAPHGVSYWNPYERRIRHFAALFVFKGLALISFRRFFSAPVFSDFAPLFVSRRNRQNGLATWLRIFVHQK